MKSDKTLHIAREESFVIESPEVFVTTMTSTVTISESHDGRCHVKILSKSKNALEEAGLVEISAEVGELNVRFNKKGGKFWGISNDWFSDLSAEISLPSTSKVEIKSVSGDIEINQALTSLQIGTISGDVVISQNPATSCVVKTVSGDIETHTFSACDYKLKSVSGDIKVHIAPDLTVEVDGNSVSGELNSEISLDGTGDSSADSNKIVTITTSTISGNFNLARN
jgi:hypothetical protein